MTITRIMASASAASVPGLTRITSSASAQASVLRTSIATIRAPRRLAISTCRSVWAWLTVFAPHRITRSECAPRSSLLEVSTAPVRPRPNAPNPQQTIAEFQYWQP